MLESFINETQSLRLVRDEITEYMFIKPPYKDVVSNCEVQDYNSKINPLTKFELKQYLHELKLITLPVNEILNLTIDSAQFKETNPFPYLKVLNVLDESFANKIQAEILKYSRWRMGQIRQSIRT